MSADGSGSGGDGPAAPADPRYDPRFQRGHASDRILPVPPVAPPPGPAATAAAPLVSGITPTPRTAPSPEPATGLPSAPEPATSAVPEEPDRDGEAPASTERARRALVAVSVLLLAVAAASWLVALGQRDPFTTRYTGWDFWRDQVVLPTAPALAAAGILGLALWLAMDVVAPRRPPSDSAGSSER